MATPSVCIGTRQSVSVCFMLRQWPPIGFSLPRFGALREKGNMQHPVSESAQVKIQVSDYPLLFLPSAQFFIHIGISAPINVIACPGRKCSYVTVIVADHLIRRVLLSPNNGSNDWVKKRCRLCACRFNYLHHLPSALFQQPMGFLPGAAPPDSSCRLCTSILSCINCQRRAAYVHSDGVRYQCIAFLLAGRQVVTFHCVHYSSARGRFSQKNFKKTFLPLMVCAHFVSFILIGRIKTEGAESGIGAIKKHPDRVELFERDKQNI